MTIYEFLEEHHLHAKVIYQQDKNFTLQRDDAFVGTIIKTQLFNGVFFEPIMVSGRTPKQVMRSMTKLISEGTLINFSIRNSTIEVPNLEGKS